MRWTVIDFCMTYPQREERAPEVIPVRSSICEVTATRVALLTSCKTAVILRFK